MGLSREIRQSIRVLGDPILRTTTDPVTEFGSDLNKLINSMFATMYAADGVGLAANQIGVGLSVLVYDCEDDNGRRFVGHIINPTLVQAAGERVSGPEGCLSVPGLYYDTPRYDMAVVRGLDRKGKDIEVAGTGFFARCLQHETDHLQGKLYIDLLTGATQRRVRKDIEAADWSNNQFVKQS